VPSAAARYLSPLRYPGGKGRLAPFVGALLQSQSGRPTRYVEPFAGGAGVGLRLLFDEYVEEVVLNDLNRGIAAFWKLVFEEADALIDRLRSTEATVDEWHRQRELYLRADSSPLELGFATFYLNRTNRSGILDARPIGGLDQTGRWPIDARYDQVQLANRIRLLARYSSRVVVCQDDGVDLVDRYLRDANAFIYADPPYLVEGDDLYLHAMRWEDHKRLAKLLKARSKGWFLTYDADPRITEVLYPDMRCAQFQTSHTAARQHVGHEYAIFASELHVPSLDLLGSGTATWVAHPEQGQTAPKG
jgi:DNA adenine methylase